MDDPSWTHEAVLAKIEEQFPQQSRPEVINALDEYRGDTPAGRARVQLAILAIARGDLETVRRFTAYANEDFRDVLYQAAHQPP